MTLIKFATKMNNRNIIVQSAHGPKTKTYNFGFFGSVQVTKLIWQKFEKKSRLVGCYVSRKTAEQFKVWAEYNGNFSKVVFCLFSQARNFDSCIYFGLFSFK